MSTKHTPEQWRWGFFKHRRDLEEPCRGGTCTPFYEFRPISENHEFGNGTVLAVCDYGHILKIEDHWKQCILASQGGDGGESDILVSDEFADIIAAAPETLAACKVFVREIERVYPPNYPAKNALKDLEHEWPQLFEAYKANKAAIKLTEGGAE